MTDAGIERLLRTLTDRTIGAGDTIRLNQVLGAPIPRGIKAYLHAEILRRLREGLSAVPAYNRIDMSAPGTTDLTRSFLRSLSYSYTFPREEFLATLQDAFHFLTNYLLRPQWTLESFLFEGRESVSIDHLVSRFTYMVDYSYFAELVLRILRKRGTQEVLCSDVRALITRIDDQIVRQHNPRELARLTRPIYDFLLLEEGVNDRPIPIAPLLLFFEDKKLMYLRDYIEGVSRIRSLVLLSMDDLRRLIEDLEVRESTESAPAAPSAGEELPPALVEGATEAGGDTPDSGEPAQDSSTPFRPSGVAEGATAGPETHASHDGSTRHNAALSLTFAGLQETQRRQLLPDLDDLLAASGRKKVFVRKIFHRDEDYYAAVIKALNDIETWIEASAYLTEFFQSNSLDPFDGEVVEFTDIVQRRFQPGQEERA